MTRIVQANATGVVDEACSVLRAQGLIGLPTETVYGLAADATSDTAVASIYEAKDRPTFNPLIIHCENLQMAMEVAEFNADAHRLARAFWPGPLTMILPHAKRGGISALARAGLDSVGVRIPLTSVAREIIRRFGKPVAAPSANRSGRISPVNASDVCDELADRIPLIVDAGPCPIGLESTIVALTGGNVLMLRPGAITKPMINQALAGFEIVGSGRDVSADIMAPGQCKSHYAPDSFVRINVKEIDENEVLIKFGAVAPKGEAKALAVFQLSESGSLNEAAAGFFTMLRAADRLNPVSIAVSPIPDDGIGFAINDRLIRASAIRE